MSHPRPALARDPRAVEALPRLITVAQLCAAFALGKSTLYELHRSGRLPGYRIGGALRFDVQEVKRYLDSCREGGP